SARALLDLVALSLVAGRPRDACIAPGSGAARGCAAVAHDALPLREQVGERLRRVRRGRVPSLVESVHPVARRADAPLAGLEAQPVALADHGSVPARPARVDELPGDRAA